jgi:hypothetical protein
MGILSAIAAGAVGLGGVCLLLAGGMSLLLGFEDGAARNLLAKTPVLNHAQLLRAVRLPRRVTVQGRTVAGPEGVLTAPLSREECVWYRVRIWYDYWDARHEVNTDSMAWERAGGGDEVRLDDSTGVVLVSSDLLWRDLPSSDRSPIESPWSDDTTSGVSSGLNALRRLGLIHSDAYRQQPTSFRVEEKLVRPDQPVVALGRPRRENGEIVLHPSPLGSCGASLRPLSEVRDMSATTARGTWVVIRGIAKFGLILLAGGLAWHVLLVALYL